MFDTHKKANVILFKMIPYRLWLFHQWKGSMFEIWEKVSIEKLQNEHHAVQSP